MTIPPIRLIDTVTRGRVAAFLPGEPVAEVGDIVTVPCTDTPRPLRAKVESALAIHLHALTNDDARRLGHYDLHTFRAWWDEQAHLPPWRDNPAGYLYTLRIVG